MDKSFVRIDWTLGMTNRNFAIVFNDFDEYN